MHRNETGKEVLGLNRITKKRILELCRKDKLYQTPELNDVLYLHYQGFDRIECLEHYTELKCLWLECNAISEIQGLDKQTKLKCLFLQSNLIRKIENLEYCKELDTLNLSQNHIRKIENCGFEVLPLLNTLNLASNYLKDCECLKELKNCKNLSVLDLSNNRIDDILIVKIFSQMPELKVLVLQGNPVVSKIPQYRKTLILECKKLTYLDSRPIFPKDRACADAWKRGGYEAERKENEFWNRQERKKMRDSVNATIHLRNKHRKPTDQIALIPSSDSEEDTKDQKRDMVKQLDSTWDEVTENKSNTSSTSNTSEECESDQQIESCNDEGSITECKENSDITEDQNFKEDNTQDVKKKISNTGREPKTILERKTVQSNLDEKYDIQTTNHNDIDQEDNFNNLIKTIEEITKSEDSIQSLSKEHGENFESAENDVEDNYELHKELDETMNIFSETDQASHQIEAKPEDSSRELAIQQEYLKVNNQFKSDFEELSSNMSNFVNQLEREQEERKEVINVLFCKEIASKENSSDSSDNDYVDSSEKLNFESVTDRWDEETKIKKKHIEYAGNKQITVIAPELGINENMTDKYLSNKADYIENETVRDTKVSEKTVKRSTASFDYIPLNISSLTRKSTEALNSLERESKILKNLLQKLENNNENIFKAINLGGKYEGEDTNWENQAKRGELNLKRQTEKDEMLKRHNPEVLADAFCYNSYIQEDKIQEKVFNQEENQTEIVEQILEEILQSFDVTYIEQKPKEFAHNIPDISEEINFAYPKSVSRSIPDAIKSFNHFFNDIVVNQRANNKSSVENIHSQQDKLLIFKELSNESKIKQLTSDTLQNLDEQLEEIKRNQHKKVRRVVDRVYAQKDQYNNTLELVEGKLMMLNQHTKELHELPRPVQYRSSDSEEDYDTAQSEDEEQNTKEYSFKSTACKLKDDLVKRPVVEYKSNKSNDDSDEGNEEFFSLDCQVKPNLYNIDKEFLDKLKFDESNLTQIGDNHIVQCARSYEELKHYLILNKEKTLLTDLEQEMLDNMTKSKLVKINETSETLSECLQNNSDLTKQEQLWLKRMTLTAQQTKSQEGLGLQCHENTCEDKFDTNESEKSSENILTKAFLGDILKTRDNDKYLNDTVNKNKSVAIEQLSEEEKNEIENNIDFENCAADTTKTTEDIPKNVKDKFAVDEKKETLSGCCSSNERNVEKSIKTACDVDILECNLEIIADDDEIVDTINVHAELHF